MPIVRRIWIDVSQPTTIKTRPRMIMVLPFVGLRGQIRRFDGLELGQFARKASLPTGRAVLVGEDDVSDDAVVVGNGCTRRVGQELAPQGRHGGLSAGASRPARFKAGDRLVVGFRRRRLLGGHVAHDAPRVDEIGFVAEV
jgi:hypothetical protein